MAAVDVRELVVRYDDRVAVDRVTFAADAGEVVALLGPNGAGKTSTVETCEGYRAPASGTVTVLGLDPIADRRSLAPRLGAMLQRGGVYPGMGPLEALRLFAAYYGDRAADPLVMLDDVGLRDVARTPWRRLSGGEQQRLSLGLALIGRPDVVFLDEPTAGVDPAGRVAIRSLLRALRDEGRCVVLTTHDLEEVEKVADRVVILDEGRVVAQGAPTALLAGAADAVRFSAAPGLDVGSLGAHVGATARETAAGEYEIDTAPTPATVAALTAWLADRDIALGDLRAGRQTLEDLFLRLTADGRDPPS